MVKPSAISANAGRVNSSSSPHVDPVVVSSKALSQMRGQRGLTNAGRTGHRDPHRMHGANLRHAFRLDHAAVANKLDASPTRYSSYALTLMLIFPANTWLGMQYMAPPPATMKK